METLKGAQRILQCKGFFAMTDGDIVSRPTNSNFNNFNKTRPFTLFFPPNIVSITISCNTYQCLHAICEHFCVLHVHYKINVLIFYERCTFLPPPCHQSSGIVCLMYIHVLVCR